MRFGSLALIALWSLLAFLGLGEIPLQAQETEEEKAQAEFVHSRYTKREVYIPMRDGTRLFTAIYSPKPGLRIGLEKGLEEDETDETSYPFLMLRTPYDVGPYGADRYRWRLGPHAAYPKEGFIFVYQDVRGRYMSEGEFVNMRPHIANKRGPQDVDESTDTYDTIEWLLANVPGHNGKVGLWGVSYPGFFSAAGAIDSHPALAAVSPQAPISDWFWDDMHRHGAFILPLTFNFFASFGQPRPEPTTEDAERFDHGTVDGYQFFLDLGPLKNANAKHLKGEIAFWNHVVAHPNYDEFWQQRNILPHLHNVKAAVMVVGGWYDTEDLYGPLEIYRSIEEKNPNTFNVLVMGPWPHGGWNRREGTGLGTADFGYQTGVEYRRRIDLAFFKHFLKGEGEHGLPEALVFETGANRWRQLDAWPPRAAEPKALHLRADGALSFEPATKDEAGSDAYPSNPAKPVPYTQEITARWAKDYMTEDQRHAARRPDVLVYQSEVLKEDVTLAGGLETELWVSTTGQDADWVVKLIDVFPGRLPGVEDDEDGAELGGQQQLVRWDVMRGRFRNSYEQPEPFVPGQVTKVRFETPAVFHTFKRGHRIMVQVQSTFFPLVDRNPQTWVENIFEADEEDYQPAVHQVHRGPEYPSRVEVGVLPQGWVQGEQ